MFMLIACSTIEEKELYGKWEGEGLLIQLNEDKTAVFGNGLAVVNATFNKFGNTIELINENNKVVFNMRLKEVKDGKLYINIPSLGTDAIKELKKVQ